MIYALVLASSLAQSQPAPKPAAEHVDFNGTKLIGTVEGPGIGFFTVHKVGPFKSAISLRESMTDKLAESTDNL